MPITSRLCILCCVHIIIVYVRDTIFYRACIGMLCSCHFVYRIVY